MAKTRIMPRAQHADKTQTFLNDITNAIEVFEDKIGSMSSATKQKSIQKLPVVIPGGADSHLEPRAIRRCRHHCRQRI